MGLLKVPVISPTTAVQSPLATFSYRLCFRWSELGQSRSRATPPSRLVAASIQVVAELHGWSIGVTTWLAAGICFVIRFLALRFSWSLPVPGARHT